MSYSLETAYEKISFRSVRYRQAGKKKTKGQLSDSVSNTRIPRACPKMHTAIGITVGFHITFSKMIINNIVV